MAQQENKPVLAVTIGEPGGIGPEIVAQFFASYRPARSHALIVGALPVIKPYLPKALTVVDRSALDSRARLPRVAFLETGCTARHAVGRDSRGGGRHAWLALETACRLSRQGLADGIVTAPLSKRSLDLAGYRFTGHTEVLAKYFGAPDCQMMMVYRDFRVVPLTRHIPIRRLPRRLKESGIVSGLTVVHKALEAQFGIRSPRLAVAGLNPHAGEGGVLGREDLEVIRPAIRTARRRGIDAEGPLPADAMFQEAESGMFDAFIAMYHDQGLIPFKMVARRRGVNVTVGLPVVRTSVDHGVAYDVAGTGTASHASLKAAYQLAEKLALRGKIGTG